MISDRPSARPPSPPRGRGASSNPKNRFTRLEVEPETPPPGSVATVFLRDGSRSALTRNQSPDVPFDASVNPYRGCEHGCVYCYARPTHEYLGFSAGLDFESRILVKEDAPALLASELASPRWQPQVVALSGVTDPYQPIEKRLGITRRVLEVLVRFRNPVAVVTKNHLVTRDIDLLATLAEHDGASVMLSVTTLDVELVRRMEPRTSHPERRLDAIRALTEAGVPCGVLVAPVIPGINDHEIPAILEAAAEAGARSAGWVMLRLPGAVAPLFGDWLETWYPERKRKVLGRIASLRGGALHDGRFGRRMRGEGTYAEHVKTLFDVHRRKHGLARRGLTLSAESFERPGTQRSLFG